MRISHFLIPVGYGYLVVLFFSGLYTMHEPSYLGKSALGINMLKNCIDPNHNSGTQRFSHLNIPTKYQYLTGVTNLIPMGRLFDAVIDGDY